MEVVLIRHTRTAADRDLIAGWTDVPLAETFPSEAQAIFAHVGTKPDDCIITSPSQRCIALAKLFGAPHTDERFREVHFGSWEGRRWREIPADELTPWMDDFVSNPPPGGESSNDLATRVKSALASLDPSIARFVIVAHAGVLRVAAAYFLGLPLEKMFNFACEPGSILRARKTPHGWQVLEWLSGKPTRTMSEHHPEVHP
jgi:alpha-ribazole phosphatase